MTERHVSVTDLPGYMTPATVAEILDFPDSYGFVWVNGGIFSFAPSGIAQGEGGKLWANPKAPLMDERPDDDKLWAVVAWTENGLGVFVPRHSYRAIAHRKLSSASLEGWIPIVEVLPSVPGSTAAEA